MEQVRLQELNMKTRAEAIGFLKRLWNGDQVPCPLCGHGLEMLHKKAKKSNDDWQCRICDKTFKTMNLLMEINEQLPT